FAQKDITPSQLGIPWSTYTSGADDAVHASTGADAARGCGGERDQGAERVDGEEDAGRACDDEDGRRSHRVREEENEEGEEESPEAAKTTASPPGRSVADACIFQHDPLCSGCGSRQRGRRSI